ncbi:MAG: glutamine amidotransferase [candidate division SR1 bacterium]|nr:glutamine amidotransferase [candidate division SR1 bacterium]
MSIYGDMGNIIAMRFRLEKYGFEVIYQIVGQGQDLPETTDWYFMGGGQDKEQEVIYQDLLKKKKKLSKDIENGVGLLAICGGYQLLGKQFITGNGVDVEGLGIFNVITKASGKNVKQRCIGNVVEECMIDELKGQVLVGFENHGGQTEAGLAGSFKPLGRVIAGFGNTYDSGFEGCVYKNAIGTYLHGSCLPKNPQLTDWFIHKAIEKQKLVIDLPKIDDMIGIKVRECLLQRFG